MKFNSRLETNRCAQVNGSKSRPSGWGRANTTNKIHPSISGNAKVKSMVREEVSAARKQKRLAISEN